MKKTLILAAAFLVVVPSFSQAQKTKTEKKSAPQKTEAKAPVQTEAKAPTKLEQKSDNQNMVIDNQVQAVREDDTPISQTTIPATPPQDVNKMFEFKNEAFDFGKIPAGKAAKYDLFIKNISKESAELTLVQPGCGCTTPEYEQKKKFAPGETVKVTLGFNGGAPGAGLPFSKSVTVTLNSNLTKLVTFKGETYAVPTESAPANGAIDKLKPKDTKN